jgi:hypothetical protein
LSAATACKTSRSVTIPGHGRLSSATTADPTFRSAIRLAASCRDSPGSTVNRSELMASRTCMSLLLLTASLPRWEDSRRKPWSIAHLYVLPRGARRQGLQRHAVQRKKLIRTVPHHHVILQWALRQISPRAVQPLFVPVVEERVVEPRGPGAAAALYARAALRESHRWKSATSSCAT